jgi:hypothetical protein
LALHIASSFKSLFYSVSEPLSIPHWKPKPSGHNVMPLSRY